MQSIRSKITFGYYLFAACMIGSAVFAYANLRFLEQRLDWGAAVSGFLDTTLEMRRFEKNFFLYGKPEDAASAQAYAGQALALLEQHTTAYRELAAAADLERLRDRLERYTRSMAQRVHASDTDAAERDAAEREIRELGRELSDSAERISASEHDALRTLLNTARATLVGLLAAITLFSLVLAHVLTRAVVQPLRGLEQDLQAIGQGRLDSLPARSGEREIVSFTDAFNRTLHELELRRRHLLQSEKLASLGTLVSGVAHELNNPLSNISTSTQLLVEELDAADPAQITAWLRDIEEQTERARHIVATLLDFSRDSPFALQPTALRGVLEKTVTLLRTKVPEDCVIELDVPAELTLDADPQKLQQVFVNLLGNAIEAGGRKIRVRAPEAPEFLALEHYVWTRAPAPNESTASAVYIAVSDDGPGIAPAVLPKVFDPFFTTKDVGHGSGLGLYLVQEIVEQHGGSIGVSSTPGQGSTFLIRLPRRLLRETPV
ncbi:MAG: HAMP domain-containing histidine kinase [Gammaproteobacteria bacterium]|nr:HAMP domain-containing histidine kinase [Gammaproteobacteria bacterium]